MSVVPKSLFTWLVFLIFIIFLVIRIDGKVSWNWFIIFIPMWVLDSAIMIHLIVNIVMHVLSSTASTVDRNDMTKRRKIGLYVGCLLKVVFQVLLCLRLESFQISLFYVFIPLWLLLALGIVDNGRVLIAKHPYR